MKRPATARGRVAVGLAVAMVLGCSAAPASTTGADAGGLAGVDAVADSAATSDGVGSTDAAPQADGIDGAAGADGTGGAAGTDGGASDAQAGPSCGGWGAPVSHAKVPPPVDEASGLAVSTFDPGVLWTHNDGGDGRLFAVRASTGALVATLTFPGLPAPSPGDKADWEDLAAGPCGAGATAKRCLYIGDIGDNGEARATVRVFRIPEPDPASGSAAVTKVETLVLSYPGSKRNSEGLVVDAIGTVWLVSKSKTTIRLFRAPFPATGDVSKATLELVAKVDPKAAMQGDAGRITGADWDPQRQRLALRTNDHIWELCLGAATPGGQGPGLAGFAGATWHKVIAAPEPQGEAVAYSEAGIWHLSEGAWQRPYLLPRPK